MGNLCPKKEKSDSEAPLISKKSNLERNSNQRRSVDEESKFSYYNSKGEEGVDEIDTKKLQFKDFQIVRVLGKGAFGTVYLVTKKGESTLMAMKSLRKSELIKKNQLFNTKTERNILQLNGSNFIVKLYYAFQTNDKFYMVLEYMQGGELFFHLKKQKRFSEDRVKYYAASVILALEYLHKFGVIYRDLKPENVLMDAKGNIKLTDFGLSKKAANATTFCGTPEYLAPEVLLGETHDKAIDWWSLGILIYEMLAGMPPFYSKDTMYMYKTIVEKEPKMKPWFSPEVGDLIIKLLDKNSATRLGADKADAEKIKSHPWFNGFDWRKMSKMELTPPFVPEIAETDEFKYFDPNLAQNWEDEDTYLNSHQEDKLSLEQPSHNADGRNAGMKGMKMDGFTYENEGAYQKLLQMKGGDDDFQK